MAIYRTVNRPFLRTMLRKAGMTKCYSLISSVVRKMEPNLCVIQNEAGDEWVFEGDNTQNEFCEWLFQKERANCVVMAHNFQGYDSYFILQYLRENGVKYDVIMRGAKVLSLSVDMFKIKFIDSLNFIPMIHSLLQPERNESCDQGKVFRMA